MPDISIQLAPHNKKGLLLSNPVMPASGTFGYGTEWEGLLDVQQLGGVVCKGTTLKPRNGNPQPRLIETPSGLLNSIGLQNIGVEAVINEKAPVWSKWKVPVIVNIAGESIDEYAAVASKLNGVPGISGIEINISCPNVDCGGMEFGIDPEISARVTARVKSETNLPVIVKLSPNVTDITGIAKAVAEAGADAITLINTLRGMMIDSSREKPSLGNIIGGLSGRAIKPVALYMVYKVASVVKVPLIGCGGISSTEDALEFIMAGASAIQIGTAGMADPSLFLKVIEGIEHYLENKNIKCLQDIVGIAHRKS
jgi:dihydroorotate dehydrogenase (NAD+) catalytic subunit